MKWAGLALLSMVVGVGARAAEPDRWFVSVCGVVASGDSERDARERCTRLAKREGLSKKRCDCGTHADVVHLEAGKKPAFWIAAYTFKARSAKAATAACKADFRRAQGEHPDERVSDWHCDEAVAVYGPFKRKPYADDMDDSRVYDYLSATGSWLDKDGLAPCFVAGTPVAMADGTMKPIEQVRAGELVLSYADGEVVVSRVERSKERRATTVLTVRFEDGRELGVTPNHPLWSASRGAWVEAGELDVGEAIDVLVGGGVAPLMIVAIDEALPTSGPVPVWDLTIATTHDFFAGGALVHNY